MSPSEIELLKIQGELDLRRAELELRREESRNRVKAGRFSAPLILALVAAISTGVGASLQGYWATRVEHQKFEAEMIKSMLNDGEVGEYAKRLAFLADTGIITTLNADKIKKLATQNPKAIPDLTPYVLGKKDGATMAGIVRSLEAFEEINGVYPEHLDQLCEAKELIASFGPQKLRYTRRADGKGFRLTFAGADGVLDTVDDRHHTEAPFRKAKPSETDLP